MRRRSLIILAGSGLIGLGLSACGGGGSAPRGGRASGGGVLAAARGAGAGRFARAAEGTELAETLAGSGPFTLFAPSDRAFAAANAGRMGEEALLTLLAYHVVPGDVTLSYMEGFDLNHTTLTGRPLNVDGRSGTVVVGGTARLVRADVPAGNGVVHVIDAVLRPR